jgi:hypothetical protein
LKRANTLAPLEPLSIVPISAPKYDKKISSDIGFLPQLSNRSGERRESQLDILESELVKQNSVAVPKKEVKFYPEPVVGA